MNAPENYSWYDMFMKARYAAPTNYDYTVYAGGPHWHAVWYWADGTHTTKENGVYIYLPKYIATEFWNMRWIPNSTPNIYPLRWDLYGYKCYLGKKKIPVYNWNPATYSGFNYVFNYDAGVVVRLPIPLNAPIQLVFSWQKYHDGKRVWHPYHAPYLITTYEYLPVH